MVTMKQMTELQALEIASNALADKEVDKFENVYKLEEEIEELESEDEDSRSENYLEIRREDLTYAKEELKQCQKAFKVLCRMIRTLRRRKEK